jgi:hypothetical protein
MGFRKPTVPLAGLLVGLAVLIAGTTSAPASTTATPSVATDVAWRFPPAPRIVAIGDLHGDFDVTRRALRLAGALDATDHWAGGDLVLVQTGDILDRGDGEQDILDLFARLRREAREAGGAVHVLNGNHELINAEQDLRYVTPGGYADFADAEEVAAAVASALADPADTLLLAYEPEQRARVAAFRPGGPYARQLAEYPVVLIVGNNVFVHGSVERKHLAYGIERLNREVRAWLLGEGPVPEGIRQEGSVVWSRRYSDEVDAADCAELAEVLRELGAERMIVGHTPQEEGITPLCDGDVWCIDTGLAAHYGGELQVLEIVGDSVRALTARAPTATPAADPTSSSSPH